MSRDAYQIRLEHSLGREVERLFRGQVNRARRSLHRPDDTGVHSARKAVKRARALLRLVRGRLPDARYRDLDVALRAVGRRLGPVRDAAVALGLIGRLRDEGALPPSLCRRLASHGEARRSAARAGLDADGSVEAVRNRLGELRLAHDEVAGLAAIDLVDGLSRTYATGKTRLARAREGPHPDVLHAWRRHAKHLGYQLRLVAPAWPLVLRPTARAIDRLTEALGDDHDLAELARAVRHAGLDPEQVRALDRAVRTRQDTLQATLWPLGARLYAEGSESFADRLLVYLSAALDEAHGGYVLARDASPVPTIAGSWLVLNSSATDFPLVARRHT